VFKLQTQSNEKRLKMNNYNQKIIFTFAEKVYTKIKSITTCQSFGSFYALSFHH